MKGSRAIEIILDILQAGTETTAALADAMTSSGKSWSEIYKDRQKFYALLNHPKSHGLINSEKQGKGSLWKITYWPTNRRRSA